MPGLLKKRFRMTQPNMLRSQTRAQFVPWELRIRMRVVFHQKTDDEDLRKESDTMKELSGFLSAFLALALMLSCTVSAAGPGTAGTAPGGIPGNGWRLSTRASGRRRSGF